MTNTNHIAVSENEIRQLNLVETAVSASSYSIPRRFLWLADVLTQIAAVCLAFELTPLVRDLLLAVIPLAPKLLAWMSPTSALEIQTWTDVIWLPITMAPPTLLAIQVLGGYSDVLNHSRTRTVVTATLAPFVGLSFVTLLLTAVRIQHTSRTFIFSTTLLTALGFAAYRIGIRKYKRGRLIAGYYARNVLVIGPSDSRRWLVDYLTRNVSPSLYRLYGYLDSSPDADSPLPGLDYLGEIKDLGDLLIHRPIHELIFVYSAESDAWLNRVIEHCDYFRVNLRLVPAALLPVHSTKDLQVPTHGDPFGLPEIVLTAPHLDSDAIFIKRVFDIVVSGVLLILLSPFFLLIAIAIKLTTPNLPVFYSWRVIGYKGRPFTGYKFTTMTAGADELKSVLMHLNEMSGPVFKIKNDPRITPLGRILRKFSLNELPQLWSVFKGDMSLVGPRPAFPHELARYELWHKRKLCVQPGITCLWQVRGRNEISSFDEWVRMDFEYIDNWSLWLDMKILVWTVRTLLCGSGS